MKRLRLRVVASLMLVALALSACGATLPTPTATPAVVSLPASAAAAQVAVRATPTQALLDNPAASAPGAVPTRVLSAPLPTGMPTMLAGWRATPTPQPSGSGAAVVAPIQPLTGRIVLQTSSGGSIMTVNADGTGQDTVSNGLDPSWSPDGKQIAVARWSEPQGIYVMNADGSNARMIYQINGAKSPTWSPDGTKIAFTWLYRQRVPSFRGTPIPGILGTDFWRVSIVDVNTGNKTDLPLDNDGYAFVPDWGSDGTIVYKAFRGVGESSETGTPVLITNDQLQTSPSWSPDGKRIVLMVRHHDHWDIAGMNRDGSGLTSLTETPPVEGTRVVNNVAPTWSPDGSRIAFLSDRGGDWRVYVMNADGSGQRKMLDIPVKYDYAAERVLDWTQ
jgi:dipeptidyl aminopeptidase/acylaminoacyl peptidase